MRSKLDSKAIRRCTAFLLSVAITGCHHPKTASPSPPALQDSAATVPADSIALRSVTEGDGSTLIHGKPAHLVVYLQYTLASHDTALFSLSVEQFPNKETCVPSMGETVTLTNFPSRPADAIPIIRGTHILKIPITWDGGVDADKRGLDSPSGAVSLQSSMWLESLNYRFLTRSFATEWCMQFQPN